MRGEVPLETLRYLRRSAPLAVDLQGYLRYRQGNRLLMGPYDGLREVLSLTTYVKADLAEAEIATGTSAPEEAASRLASLGPAEVLITGDNRVHLLAGDRFFVQPLMPKTLDGRTGRGDTCMATYLGSRLLNASPEQSLETAARVTSKKLETPGPFLGEIEPLLA